MSIPTRSPERSFSGTAAAAVDAAAVEELAVSVSDEPPQALSAPAASVNAVAANAAAKRRVTCISPRPSQVASGSADEPVWARLDPVCATLTQEHGSRK